MRSSCERAREWAAMHLRFSREHNKCKVYTEEIFNIFIRYIRWKSLKFGPNIRVGTCLPLNITWYMSEPLPAHMYIYFYRKHAHRYSLHKLFPQMRICEFIIRLAWVLRAGWLAGRVHGKYNKRCVWCCCCSTLKAQIDWNEVLRANRFRARVIYFIEKAKSNKFHPAKWASIMHRLRWSIGFMCCTRAE